MDKLSKTTKEAISLIYDNYLTRYSFAFMTNNKREEDFTNGVIFAINRLFSFNKKVECVGFDKVSIEILKNIAKINLGYGNILIDEQQLFEYQRRYPEYFYDKKNVESHLKKIGYRKVDEHAVVLPKSEYNDLKDMADKYIKILKGDCVETCSSCYKMQNNRL